MGVRQALDEAKSVVASLQKKIDIITKNIDKISNDVYSLQKNMKKAGMEPEDLTMTAGYAIDDLKALMVNAQKTVDLFKE